MAAATDILTLTEGRTAINNQAVNHDTQLATFITGISHRIDDLCGPVVIRTVTNEEHNGGKSRIWPLITPVDSVTTLTEYVHTTGTALSAESNASKPASAYLLDNIGVTSFVWRRSGGADSTFASGRRNIVITYEAGRYADTASVDPKFKLAVESVLRRIWKREQSSWAQAPEYFASVENPAPTLRFFKAVDPMITELLHDELLPPVGL